MELSIDDHLLNIQKNGFTVLRDGLPAKIIKDFKNRIYDLKQNVSETDIANIPKLNQGHDIVYSLEWQDHTFLRTILNHKIVFDILKSSLNDSWYKQLLAELPNFILRAMIARSEAEASPTPHRLFIPNGNYPF